ncbi:MAG TPA: glycoside hydrolase, partial [Vicinamibacteria bacterium]|nr:glycoside hydrolase [Vicinamibacteria bacterium]
MTRFRLRLALALPLAFLAAAPGRAADTGPLPVRGIHLIAPLPADVEAVVRLVREGLPKDGVNVLVLEVNYRYQFTRHPEVAEKDALSREQLRAIADACRGAGIRLIPQINMLGHQSWDKKTGGLLVSHPELDETPGLY